MYIYKLATAIKVRNSFDRSIYARGWMYLFLSSIRGRLVLLGREEKGGNAEGTRYRLRRGCVKGRVVMRASGMQIDALRMGG